MVPDIFQYHKKAVMVMISALRISLNITIEIHHSNDIRSKLEMLVPCSAMVSFYFSPL